MQLVYRGQQYLPRAVLTESIVQGDICVYRGIPYKRKQSVVTSGGNKGQRQQLKYRGIPYIRQI